MLTTILMLLNSPTTVTVEILRVWQEKNGKQTVDLYDKTRLTTYQVTFDNIFHSVDVFEIFPVIMYADFQFSSETFVTGDPNVSRIFANPKLINIRLKQ